MGISSVEGMLGESFPGGQINRGAHKRRLNEKQREVKTFWFEGELVLGGAMREDEPE